MRDKPEKEIETIKGTRKVHSVRGVETGVVKTSYLSCCCQVCLGGEKGNSPNELNVGEWETHRLFKGEKKSKEKQGGKKNKKTGKR